MNFFFLGIFLLSLFFRLYALSSNPPGIHIDEVSFAYNAYSLMHTGKDEFGAAFPIVLRSFDDYRTALFAYLSIPFIKVLGLSIFSVRLVSVVLSCLTLIALYKSTLALLKLSSQKKPQIIALCAIFLYAISPWSIFLSRIAIDTNAGLAFFSLGLWMFLQYILSKKVWHIFASFLFFALTFYAYNGIKIFLPFFLVTLGILFFQTLWERKKQVVMAFLFFVLLLSPSLNILHNTTNLSRFTTLNFFNDVQTTVLATSSQRLLFDDNDILGKIFDNRRVTILPRFINNYLTNINPTWLYADDYEHIKYKVPDFGLFYLFELPLLLLGFYFIIKKQLFSKKIIVLLITWIAFSILPAAITIDTPSAVRIYTALPAFLIIEASGLYFLMQYILQQNRLKKFLYAASLVSIILISVLWFSHAYFVTFPYERSQTYSYGVSDALAYARAHENEYQHILVSNRDDLTFSYMHYLFNTKYDPKKYLAEGGTISGNFSANHTIGKYVFLNPNIYEDINGAKRFNPKFFDKNTLYIVDAKDIQVDKKSQKPLFEKVKILKKIQYINGQDAIFILGPIKK